MAPSAILLSEFGSTRRAAHAGAHRGAASQGAAALSRCEERRLRRRCANEDDDYGLTEWRNHAERDGWRPVVHVRRGHGGVKLRTPRFSALGDEGDLTDALAAIPRFETRFPTPPSLPSGCPREQGRC